MESPLRTFGHMIGNKQLLRLVVAYALFTVSEYGVWIAILVYAYDQGGATTAGLVLVAQLIPASIAAPLVAPIADRRSPVVLLAGGYAFQGVAAATTSALLFVDATPYLVYLGSILVSTAISTTRPAQAALLPALTREVRELTAANVLIGWAESLSILLAGAGVGLTLTFGTVAHVFAGATAVLGVAVLLVVPLRTGSRGKPQTSTESVPRGGRSLADLYRNRPVRLLVFLLGAEYVVIGALDVLFVVLAIDVLQTGQAWAGYLNMAYGTGGLILGGLAVFLVGRRLGPVIVATAIALGAALATSAVTVVPGVVVVLLAVVGGSRALFDVASRALLQRAAPAHQIARIFGLAEGLSMAGIAAGAVLAPALISLGGPPLALVGVSAVLPGIVLFQCRLLLRVDQHARVPVVEIALLQSLPIFRALPPQALEGLARALEPIRFDAGSVLVREGDRGDCYFAIVDGIVEVRRSGQSIATLHRGDGLGEIALLRTGRRTATAIASTPVSAFKLDRDSFLAAVSGHTPTLASAVELARETEVRDARRDAQADDPPAT